MTPIYGWLTKCDSCGKEATFFRRNKEFPKEEEVESLREIGWRIDDKTICPACIIRKSMEET